MTNTVKLNQTVAAASRELESIDKFTRQSDKQLNALHSKAVGGKRAMQLYVLEALARLSESGSTKTLQHFHDYVLTSDREKQHFVDYLLSHIWSGKDSIPLAKRGGWSGAGLKGKEFIFKSAPCLGRFWLWTDQRSETIASSALSPAEKSRKKTAKKSKATKDDRIRHFVHAIYDEFIDADALATAIKAQWEKETATRKSKTESTRPTKRTAKK